MKHTFMHTMSSCTYRFIPSSLIDLPEQRDYELVMRQEPQRAKMSVINERDRRPIEPPPILQVHLLHCSPDDTKKSLQCPFYFMVANIMPADSDELLSTQDYLAGSTVSSLYRLRDIDDSDGGFFVFGDLYCKKQGHYRLQFSLFEIVEGNVQNRQTIVSEPFRTHMPKHYPGPVEATFLSRAFSDQGVKMRIRKEHRLNSNGATRKRKLEVQALVESQSRPLKATVRPLSPPMMTPHRHTHPVRIAPASSTVYHPIDTTRKYTSPPPSLPSNCSHTTTTCVDDFPITLLDEYHLQSTTTTSCASSVSSSPSYHHDYSYSHPTTPPPHDHYSPSLQHHVWGESLPPLKAVMSGYSARSTALVLPCPFSS